MTSSAATYLQAYDDQLRTDAETPSAVAVEGLGPLRLVSFAGGRGFVTYRDLAGADAATIASWVHRALDHYRSDPEISTVEWKTRGHDDAPRLHEALVEHDFQPQEVETIMVGEAAALDVEVTLPASVGLRRVEREADVRAMCAMQDLAFGDPVSTGAADAVLRRLERADGMQLWVAEAGGEVVGAGRLEPVAASDFAGIWGGAVLPGWRGRGIYRALTAARAHAALALGRTLVHSDSTRYSRPILERSGLIAVSSTTPFVWRRPTGSQDSV